MSSDGGPQQEMSLEEWVHRLPSFHKARKEWEALKAKVEELEMEIKVMGEHDE